MFCQSHVQDSALVERVADTRFFSFVHIQEVILFLCFGGAHKILLDQAVLVEALRGIVILSGGGLGGCGSHGQAAEFGLSLGQLILNP